MPSKEVERFASILIKEVRDAAIRNLDLNLRPDARSATARRWRAGGIEKGSQSDLLIPESVDAALYFLLKAVDEGVLHLKMVDSGGRDVDLTREGLSELAGWYIGPEGWRKEYSAERQTDIEEG